MKRDREKKKQYGNRRGIKKISKRKTLKEKVKQKKNHRTEEK